MKNNREKIANRCHPEHIHCVQCKLREGTKTFVILSAGEGSRLKKEAVTTPKPLIEIEGKPMIERLISIFSDNQADEIYVIVNSYPETVSFLKKLEAENNHKLRVTIKDTPSSAHSFYELFPYVENKSFCMTTVDTIFAPSEFSAYMSEFSTDADIDGLMAVTTFMDDESPLHIETDDNMNIIGFHDENNGKCKYVSGGIYAFNPTVSAVVKRCSEKGISRMRNLQRELLANGLKIKAFPFSKIVDVDHLSDIQKAEEFLKVKN